MSARVTRSNIWQPTSASQFTTGYTSGPATCCGRGLGEREEQPVFVHALSGAASFAACLRLFRSYPLAVSPCYSGGWHRSIVLRHGGFRHEALEPAGFYVLTQDPAERFTLRPWNPADGECQE